MDWRESGRLSRRRSASRRLRFHFTSEEPARLRNVGLDSAVLQTLPMFVYKSQNFADGLECAVCLCEFEENEKARLLPNCGHSFHDECIDKWFLWHSTCPLCRTFAQPEQPVLESIRNEEPARLRNVGLDSAVLETLPMFVYKSQNYADGLGCAMCICKFGENEKARLLPNCGHSFHVECIDLWFHSQSTCPLCTTFAQPEQPVLESVRVEMVSATIPDSIPSGIHDNLES